MVIVKGRERYWRCRNLAVGTDQFRLDPQDYAAAEDAGEIVAVVHSHPDEDARPSDADRVACEASGLPWLIVSVRPTVGGELDASQIVRFEPEGFEAPLVGRPFVHGVLDCYSLVRDWYRRELGIELKDFARSDGWWDRGEDLYMRHFAEAGMVEVTGELQRGDVILMQIRSPENANHAAVYLGDGAILHHLHGRLSSRDSYVPWQHLTRGVLRHGYAGAAAAPVV